MVHEDSEAVRTAKAYLRGESFAQDELNALWKDLKKELEFGYARRVLALFRRGERIVGDDGMSQDQREKLCQQHSLCTSKDEDRNYWLDSREDRESPNMSNALWGPVTGFDPPGVGAARSASPRAAPRSQDAAGHGHSHVQLQEIVIPAAAVEGLAE